MKTPTIKLSTLAAGVAAISLACSPVLRAQTADDTSNSKTLNSSTSPNNNSSTTGSATSQTATPDQANSKDLTNSLDKNPSTAPTDSADTSATKTPADANTPEDKTASTTNENQRSSQVSDKDFLTKAAQGGMTEVELGKLAQQNASADDVKQFGARMVTDHSKANDQLKALADKKGVPVPTTLDAHHQAMVDHFQHLSGPAFDKAYVKMMVKDHEKDAAEFRAASTNAQDPDVKAFASDTLKVIESHLSDIKSIQNAQK